MGAPGGLLGRIGVEPEERGLFGWSALCLALVGAAASAIVASAETLFLKRVGVQYLPWALLLTSGVLVLSTGIAGRVLVTADRSRWLTRVLLILALLLLPLSWLLRVSDASGVFAAFLLVARHIMALGTMVFWISVADIVTTRQAKRLFGPLAACLTLGAIAGSFATDPIARWLSVEGVVWVGSGALALAALAGGRLHSRHPHRVGRRAGAPRRASRGGAGEESVSLVGLWRDSALFRLLSVSLLCGGTLSPVLFFEFSYVADAATQGPDGEARLLFLYANFRGWLNAAMLVTQLWLSSRLFRNIGLPLSVALWPASYVLGFVGLGGAPGLPVGMGALGAGRLSEDGISGSALRVLYNLFPENVRSGASGLIEGPITRIGSVLGNGGVLVALALGLTSEIAWVVLPLALFWLLTALRLWRRYPTLLVQASADRHLEGIGDDKAVMLDRGTVRALAPGLVDPDPRARRAAVDLVGDAEPRVAVEVFADAIANAPASVRPLLVDALFRVVERFPAASLDCPRAVEALEALLARPGDLQPEERADLLRSYARLAAEGDRSRRVFERALADRSAAVRLVAMAELHRRGVPPPGVMDVDALLGATLVDGDVSLRRSARHELRAVLLAGEPDAHWDARLAMLVAPLRSRADRAETAEAFVEIARVHGAAARACSGPLLRYANDRDPRVRAAVLRVIGLVGASDQSHRLIAEIGSRHLGVARAAREGLVALGAQITEPLLEAHEFGSRARRRGVLAVLRELDLGPAELQERYARALERLEEAVLLRAVLDAEPGAGLVRQRLEERVSAGIAAAVMLVSLREDDPRFVDLERRVRRSGSERTRDLLLETLEALVPDDARLDLLPLLEPSGWKERGELVAQRLGRRLPKPAAAWAELARASDPLTQRMARYFGRRDVEAEGGIGDPSGVLDPMEVAVQLQSVPVFDRLTTQQLVGLAEALESLQVARDEFVYREGDEGDGLYFILDGAVSLERGDAQRARLGPGHFFGELSTLDGVPRQEGARADEPLRLLRLDREELLAMMEEAPALGIGLSQFLSLRVRELSDREAGGATRGGPTGDAG